MDETKVVHYINQFFAGIGGEEKANTKSLIAGELPPISAQLTKALGDDFEVVKTVVCGDSYLGEDMEAAQKEVLGMIKEANPDFVVTGPAFNAGGYGVVAGTMVKTVKDELDIPVLTGMYPGSPGADIYKEGVYIVETKNSAASMRDAVKKIGKLGPKVAKGEEIGSPKEEGYVGRGVRVNFFTDKIGSQKAIEMLTKKTNGEEFETECPMPAFDRVEPGKAIKDLSKARIALVTSGDIVSKGSPDHIESSSAIKYGSYDSHGISDLTPENSETVHGGYDPVYANEDANRVLPIDATRELEKEGVIDSLHGTWYSAVDNGTAVASADAFGTEIGKKLLADNVDAVVLTNTWDTCTHCGATMVKAIERTGPPVVHVYTVTPISLTVGANRIVPAIVTPHPLRNSALIKEEEYSLHKRIVMKALKALTIEVEDQTIFED